MDDRPAPRSSGVTVAVVVAVVVCCAAPLLVAAGLVASAGVLLRNLLVIAVGVGILGWAITRAVHTIRARDRSSADRDHPRV